MARAGDLMHRGIRASRRQTGDQRAAVGDRRGIVVRTLDHEERGNVLADVGHGVHLLGHGGAIRQACRNPARGHGIDLGLDVGGPVSVPYAGDLEISGGRGPEPYIGTEWVLSVMNTCCPAGAGVPTG